MVYNNDNAKSSEEKSAIREREIYTLYNTSHHTLLLCAPSFACIYNNNIYIFF